MNIRSRFYATPPADTPSPMPEAVVVGVAQDVGFHHAVVFGAPLLPQCRGVLGDHFGVHRESARGDDDRLGLDRAGLGEVLPADSDHAAVVDDQIGRPGLVADLHAQVGRLA